MHKKQVTELKYRLLIELLCNVCKALGLILALQKFYSWGFFLLWFLPSTSCFLLLLQIILLRFVYTKKVHYKISTPYFWLYKHYYYFFLFSISFLFFFFPHISFFKGYFPIIIYTLKSVKKHLLHSVAMIHSVVIPH